MRPIAYAVIAAVLGIAAAPAPALAKARHSRVDRSQSAAAAPQGFDGGWTIEATTTVGSCAALVPGAVTIRDRKIVEAAGGAVSSWGYVEGDGTLVARFAAQDGRTVRANGRLTANGGSGAWSSNTDLCGGTWSAERVGAQRAAQ
jgi:hypothetical protein